MASGNTGASRNPEVTELLLTAMKCSLSSTVGHSLIPDCCSPKFPHPFQRLGAFGYALSQHRTAFPKDSGILKSTVSQRRKEKPLGTSSLSPLLPSRNAFPGSSVCSLLHSLHMGPVFLESLSIHMRLWLLSNLSLSHKVLWESTRADNLHRKPTAYPGPFHLQPTPNTSGLHWRETLFPFYLQTSL